MLLFMVIAPTAMLFNPGLSASTAKQSAWLVPFIGGIFAFPALLIAVKLGLRFPRLTFTEYMPLIAGKFGGKILSALYTLFLVALNIIIVRETSELLTMTSLFETPMIVVNLFLVLICGYISQKGIEVIVRMNQFILPLFTLAYLLAFILPLPKADSGNLLPLLEEGITPVIRNIGIPALYYSETAVLLMLIPFINKPQETLKKGSYAVMATIFFMTFGSLSVLVMIGPEMTGKMIFPLWFVAKGIEYGNYIQRVETILLPLWLTGIMIKSSLFINITVLAATQTISRKHPKLIAVFIGLVVFGGATFAFPNTMVLLELLTTYWPPLAVLFQIMLPFLVLVLAVIRKKEGGVSFCKEGQ